MTEAWRDASLQAVLWRADGWLSARKARLIACAWAREVVGRLNREAVEVAERFADGEATAHELAAIRFGSRHVPERSAWPVCWPPDEDHSQMLRRCVSWVVGFSPGSRREGGSRSLDARLADIVRDVVGDPADVRPIETAWRAWDGGTVVKLARATYDGRAYDQMPILADALEEAGCADGVILDHCRGERGHVRGCWVLDAVLGLV